MKSDSFSVVVPVKCGPFIVGVPPHGADWLERARQHEKNMRTEAVLVMDSTAVVCLMPAVYVAHIPKFCDVHTRHAER